jgi:lipid A ethanolaminephosphotransferase
VNFLRAAQARVRQNSLIFWSGIKKHFYSFKPITNSRLIVLVAGFLILFGNASFFSNVTAVYAINLKNFAFLGSLALVFGSATVLLLSLVCYKYTIKPVLITVLLISSITSYFMNSFNVAIDEAMIQNIVNTDVAETLDLVTAKMLFYVAAFGIAPSMFIYKVNIANAPFKKEFVSRAGLLLIPLALIISVVLVFGGFYASFLREHKQLRYYANPINYVFSTVKYINENIKGSTRSVTALGADAIIPVTDIHRELIIFVVGETVRADRFSLNGYERKTNPFLEKEGVFSFSNFWSCGTSTAVSVPCMFSIYNQSEFNASKAQATENLLDVLKHAGVNVLWIDNNSSSKGVAVRVPYESYKTPKSNPACDIECRDVGMLSHIQAYIDEHQKGDIFIVLHQMGSHGPAYYKRYPAEFEKFAPACKTNQLENCSKAEIDNSYDNTIIYTDYFLSEVIKLLKRNDTKFESAMFYVGDHGESLGEHGIYLHGIPLVIAPEAQRHVPAVVWFSGNYDELDRKSLAVKKDGKYTHDNVFHTVLGFMEIETSVYKKEMDIVHSGSR